MDIQDILSRVDHTLLRPGAKSEEIISLCDEAIRYGTASVCISPCHVAGARAYAGDRLAVCTVIGFPHGACTSAVKKFEAARAVADGADELDMVINLSMVADGFYDGVLEEIRQVRSACPDQILKVIIETCLLTEAQKIQLCDVVSRSGADYIKTSTGFSTGGATARDVALLREHSAPELRVKAAGGIASLADAEQFIALGADRLGTSRIIALARAGGLLD